MNSGHQIKSVSKVTRTILMITFLAGILVHQKTELYSRKILIYQTDEEIKRYIKEIDKELVTPNEAFNLTSWISIQEERISRVEKICKKELYMHKMPFTTVDLTWIEARKANLITCFHPKVASTSWKNEFAVIQNLMTSDDVYRNSNYAEHFKIKDIKKVLPLLRNNTSFTTVRHPYSRIISAYKNKILDKKDKAFIRRGHMNAITRRFTDLSFVSFVKNILFEFHTGKINGHWKPYYLQCEYCRLPTNYILKLETFAEDLQGLQMVANITFSTFNKIKNKSKGDTEKQDGFDYIGSLPDNIRNLLYNAYKMDFHMFGYTQQQYEY